jgi:hypothetical protein
MNFRSVQIEGLSESWGNGHLKIDELFKIFIPKVSIINYCTNIFATDVMIEGTFEKIVDCSAFVPFFRSRVVKFVLESLEKETTELLGVLLDVSLMLSPAKRLDKGLW